MNAHAATKHRSEHLQKRLLNELGPSMNSEPANSNKKKQMIPSNINLGEHTAIPDVTRVPYDPSPSHTGASPNVEPFLLKMQHQMQHSPPQSPYSSPTRQSPQRHSSLNQSQSSSHSNSPSPNRRRRRPVLSPILKSFATVLPTVTMEAKDLRKWLLNSALDPSINHLVLRPLIPDEIKEHVEELHHAYASVAREVFRNCKLLSSPLGSLMEQIWDSYVESLKSAIDAAQHPLNGRHSRVSSGKLKQDSLSSVSVESSSLVFQQDGSRISAREGNTSIIMDTMGDLTNITTNGSAQLMDGSLTGSSPHNKKNQRHHRHKHHHSDHATVAPVAPEVPVAIREIMQRMAEHTVSFQRMRQVMFGHLQAAGKAVAKEKQLHKDANQLDYTQSQDRRISGTTRHLNIHHHADKATQRIVKRRAAIRMQAVYRARRAKKILHAKRLKNLMEVTQFEFAEKMKRNNAEYNIRPPTMSTKECCDIAERSLWESQRFVRDMTMDLWRNESKDEKKAREEEVQRRLEKQWRSEATETLQGTLDDLLEYTHAINGEVDMTDEVLKTVTKCVDQARGEKDDRLRWQPLQQASKKLREGLKRMSMAVQKRRGNKVMQSVQTTGTFDSLAKAWMAEETFKAQRLQEQEDKRNLETLQGQGEKHSSSTKKNTNKKSKSKKSRKKPPIEHSDFLPDIFKQYVTVTQDHGRPMRLVVLLAFIEEIYDEKMIYDEVDDREGHPRHGLPEFIHDHLFRRYGLRSLADHHLYDLIASLRLHKEQKRVQLFMRFLSMQEANKCALTKDALDFVLYCIAFTHTMFDNHGRPVVNHQEGESSSRIPVKTAVSMSPVIVSILVQNGPPLVKRMGIDCLQMMTRVKTLIKTQAVDHKGGTYIDYDVLLDILVMEFEWVSNQLKEHLRCLFIKGDLNADGVLTLDEFTSILREVAPGVSNNRIHRMFKAALANTQESSDDHNVGVNTITPEAFVLTCGEYGVLSGDHRTYVPPRPMTRRDSMELRVAALDDVSTLKTKRNSNGGEKEGEYKDVVEITNVDDLSFESGNMGDEEGNVMHSPTTDEWQKRKEARKQKKLTKKSSIHRSTHELVINKVKSLLAQGMARFGDEHKLVRETHFLVKAYNRDSNNRTAFHRLTRVVQQLTELLDTPIDHNNEHKIVGVEDGEGNRMVGGERRGEEKNEGDVLQSDEDVYEK